MIDQPSYPILKNVLNFDVALEWLVEDAKDDFFPDPLGFRDLRDKRTQYLAAREHRLLQHHALQAWREWVPKKNGMLREAVWLQPMHRILYTACLHYLLPRLDPKLTRGVYSYRLDTPEDPDKYPFLKRMDRWLDFHNDFREAALEERAGAVLVTDLASFFDHINCTKLCHRIETLLGPGRSDADEHVVSFMHGLLRAWSNGGDGIPQNLDPSSFFGSLYMHPVDHEMVRDRFRYFRWIDDIRVVAQNKKQALRALHALQRHAQDQGLFLSSAKTYIFEKGTPEFEALMDVEDDRRLSRAAEQLSAGDCETMRGMIPELLERLTTHAAPDGDDRKFRAFANRLLSMGEYEDLKELIGSQVRNFVVPRLQTHPDRSDYWSRMLAWDNDDQVLEAAHRLLIKDPSIFDWQRFHLWRLLLSQEGPLPRELIDHALHLGAQDPSEAVIAMALVVAGKHGTAEDREHAFRQHMTPQRSYLIQRAALTAIQELPVGQRDSYFDRACDVNPEHREFVEYLKELGRPRYGELPKRPSKSCREAPRVVRVTIERGVGLVQGRRVRFRLSRSDLDYE